MLAFVCTFQHQQQQQQQQQPRPKWKREDTGRKQTTSTRREMQDAQALLARNGMPGMGMPNLDTGDDDDDDGDESVKNEDDAAAMAVQIRKVTPIPRVRVGSRNLIMHSELVEMTESTSLYDANDFEALRARLETDGFLFVRRVIPPETVCAARTRMLSHLRSKGAIRDDTPWEQAYIEYQSRWNEKQRGGGVGGGGANGHRTKASAVQKMIAGWTVDAESGGLVNGPEKDTLAATRGWHDVGNSAELVAVYNGPALHAFYSRLFGASSAPGSSSSSFSSSSCVAAASTSATKSFVPLPNCTWLRAKGPGEVTVEHVDYFYFAAHSHIFGDNFVSPLTPTKAATQSMSEDERFACQICHDPRDGAHTLICDLCGRGFHMSCVRPRITVAPTTIPGTDGEEQEWHCYECQNLPLPYWTCWIPLGDISGLDGRLALIPGTHRLQGYESPVRDGLLPRDYTKAVEATAVWHTPSRIDMGDLILFNIKTVHAATRNAGERFRLSLDTRVRGDSERG